jgi:hypothetical protein
LKEQPERPEFIEPQQTRREFIWKILAKSAYVVPAITSYSVASAVATSKFNFMVKDKKDPSPMMSPSMGMGMGMLWTR